MIRRRSFITGLAAAFATPAIVKAASLDYVPRGALLRRDYTIWSDRGARDMTVYLLAQDGDRWVRVPVRIG